MTVNYNMHQKNYLIAICYLFYCTNSPSWNMNFELIWVANMNYHRIMRMATTVTRVMLTNAQKIESEGLSMVMSLGSSDFAHV